MGLFNHITGKTNDENIKMNMTHYSGLPNFPDEALLNMILDEQENALRFEIKIYKNIAPVILPLSKIISAGNVNITETKEQSKMGRAVVGGLLFGGAGAIVGALTAKEKEKLKTVYIINYTTEDGEKSIVLKDLNNPNYSKFQKQLESYLPKGPDNITL